MSWLNITCERRDAIYYADRPEKLRPLSLHTNMSSEYDGEPQLDITWGLASTDTPVIREVRYPARHGGPDRKSCEYYAFQDDGERQPPDDYRPFDAGDLGRCWNCATSEGAVLHLGDGGSVWACRDCGHPAD